MSTVTRCCSSSGLSSESVTVDRFGTEVITVAFHISNTSLLLRLQEILERKSVAYGVSGKLYIQHSGGSRKLRVESAGQLDLGGTSTELDAIP